MKIFLAIFVLVIVLLFGVPLVRLSRSKIGLEAFPFYSILFVLIGILFSQSALNVFTDMVLTQIFPIIGFSLGWLGFLMTIDLDFHLIRKVDSRDVAYSLIFSAGAFLFVGVGFFFVFRAFFQQIPSSMAWLLASLSVTTSPILLRLLIKKRRKRSLIIERLSLITVLGGIAGVLSYGIVVSFLTENPWWRNLIFTLIVGIGSGLFINLMVVGARRHNETLLFVYGIIFLSSGLASLLDISPLFVNAVAGLFVANSSVKKSRIAAILYEAEQLIVVLIYVLFGALWTLQLEELGRFLCVASVGALLYVFLRHSGKLFGALVIKKFYNENVMIFANNLICQISVLLALLTDFRLMASTNQDFVNLLFLGMFFAVLLSMIVASYFLNNAFNKLA